jgi:chromosome segregation ATPase
MLRKKISSGQLSREDDAVTREEIKSREQLLLDNNKSWEQKLHEQRQNLGEEFAKKEEEHVKKVAEKEEEQKKLIEENKRILAEKEKEKAEEIKKQKIEYEMKQEEFETTRILTTATKLNEYYEERVKGIQEKAEQKIAEIQKECDGNILKIKAETNRQLSETTSSYEQKIENIKFDYEKKFAALRVEQDKFLKEMDTKTTSDFTQYKNKAETLQKELLLANKKFQSQLSQLQSDRQILNRQLQTLQNKLQDKTQDKNVENKAGDFVSTSYLSSAVNPTLVSFPRFDRVPSNDRELPTKDIEEIINGVSIQKKEDEQKYDELKLRYTEILKKINPSLQFSFIYISRLL